MMAATWQQQPGSGPTSHHNQHQHHPSSNTVVAPNTNLHAANNTTPMQAGAGPGAGEAVLLSPQGSATEDDTPNVPITPSSGKLSLQDEKQIALSQLEELENAIATRKVTKIDGRKTRWKEYHEEKQRQQELTGTPVNKKRNRKKSSTNSSAANENSENEAVINNNNINKSPVSNKAADAAAVSMKMDVLNTSNSNLSHAATSPLGSVETNNVLESMKQQFLQGTENVPENVINGKLGIDEKDKNKRNSRSRRVAGRSPKGRKSVTKDEITTQVINPQVGSPVTAKAPETTTSPITPADNLTPVAAIPRTFFPPQTNSLTKGLRGIRKTDESPTKSTPRSPIASPLLPPAVTPFSIPIINSTESPAKPVTPSLTPVSEIYIRETTEKINNLIKTASIKETTPKITRTSTSRSITKDKPKNTKFSLLDDSTESPSDPVTSIEPNLLKEKIQDDLIGGIISTKLVEDVTEKVANVATKITPKITRGSNPRAATKVGPKNKDTNLANGNVSESINDTPKSSKETAKIISKDLKPNLREIKLLGKETTKITRETAKLTRSLSKENLRSTPRESLSRSTSKESLKNTDKERENLTRSLSRENLSRSSSKENLKNTDKDTSKSTSKDASKLIAEDFTPDITPVFVSRKTTPKFVSKRAPPKDTPKLVSMGVLQKHTPKPATNMEITKNTPQSESKGVPSIDILESVSKEINSVSLPKEVSSKEYQKSVKVAFLQELAKSVSNVVTQKDVRKTISKDVSSIGTNKSVSKNVTAKDAQKVIPKDAQKVIPKDAQKVIPKDAKKLIPKDLPKVNTKMIQKSSLKSTTKSNLRNVKTLNRSNSNKETLKNSLLKGPMKALFKIKPPTLKVGTQKIGAPRSTLKSKKHGIGKSIIMSLKKSFKRSAVTKELMSINEHIESKESITKKAEERKRRNSEKVLLKKVNFNTSENELEKATEKVSESLDSMKKNIDDVSTAAKKSIIKTNEKSNTKNLEKKASIPMIVNPDLDESIQLASDTFELGLEGRRTRGRPAKRKAEIEIEAQQNVYMGKSVAKANSAASHEGKMTATFIVDVHNSMSGEPQIALSGAQVGKKRRVASPSKSSTNSEVPIPKDSSSTNSSSASNTKILPVRSTRDRSTKNSDAAIDNTNASVSRLEISNASNDLQHDLKDHGTSVTTTPKSGSTQKFKSITPIFVPRTNIFVPRTPKTPIISVEDSNTSKIMNNATKPSTVSPPIVPIVSQEIPVSNVPNDSVTSPISPRLTSTPSIISVVKPIVSSNSNLSIGTSHSTSDSVTTTTSIITSSVVTSQASKPLTSVPVAISPNKTKSIPDISISKPIPQKDISEKTIISPPNKSLVKKAISLEDISQLQTISAVQKSSSLKDLSKHSSTIDEKTNSNASSTSVSNISSPASKSSPRKKLNLLTIADTLMAKKLPEVQKSNLQNPVLGMGLAKEKSAVEEIKEKAALAKKDFGSNETPVRKSLTNIVDQEKRTSSPSPSMPSLEKVTIVNLESSPVDRMPMLDRMKDSPLRELSITPLPKQTSDKGNKITKGHLRPTVETHTLTVSVAKVSSISPDSESSKDVSKSPKKKVPRVLKQLYQDEGVQKMFSSLGEGGTTEKESEEMGSHKLRPKKPTDPNIGAILDSDIDELILMHNQQTMMNKKKKKSNEVDSQNKDEGILNLLTSSENSSKRSSGQFEDSESDISSTSGKSARQVKTVSSDVSVTETRKRRLSGASSVSNASSGSMKPPDTKKAKLIGRESSEIIELEGIDESSTSNKEEVALKRGRGRPSLPDHVKQKNKAMRMQFQLQKEGRDVTVSRFDENSSASAIPQVEFIRLPKDTSKTTADSGSSPSMQGSQYIPPIKIRLPSGETSFTPPQQGPSTGTLPGLSRSVTITPISSNNSSRTVSPAPHQQQQSQAETHTVNNKTQPHGSKVLPGQLVRRSGSPDKLQQQMPQGKRIEIAASPTAASYANLVNSLIPGLPAPGKKPKEGGESSLRQSQRASVRQSEGNYRYRDISLRKFNNFVQIILTPSTTKMKNSLNTRVLRELVEALNTLKRDDTVRLVLFTATGSSFCQGIDLTALMHNNQDIRKKNAENLVRGIKEFLKALVSFHKPIVAGVNGNAMGLGVTMLPLFDLVIATDKAEFFLPYSKLGQVPEGGATYTFPSILGKLQSTRLFMGHKVSAAEACSMGLASESIWPATFQRELLPKVALIAQNSSQSMEATKALMNHHLITKLELSLESECRLLLQHWLTPQFTMLCKRFLDSQLGALCMQKPVNLPL